VNVQLSLSRLLKVRYKAYSSRNEGTDNTNRFSAVAANSLSLLIQAATDNFREEEAAADGNNNNNNNASSISDSILENRENLPLLNNNNNSNNNSNSTPPSNLLLNCQRLQLSATGNPLKKKRAKEQVADAVFSLVEFFKERDNEDDPHAKAISTAIKEFKTQFSSLEVVQRVAFQEHLSEFPMKAKIFTAMDSDERSIYLEL
jgi:hypothetical protein